LKGFVYANIIAAVAAFVGSTTVNAQATQKPEAIDYAVYSAVVDQLSGRWASPLVLIIDRTVSPNLSKLDLAESLPAELIEDFRLKNTVAYSLERDFKLSKKYRLISEAEGAARHASGAPIVALSRIGFNTKKDWAFVYFIARQTELSRKEQFVILSKEPEGWRVIRSVPRFVH
jgi:hypothetical protein